MGDLTPVGDVLRACFGGAEGRGTTHSEGCARWHSLCAYQAGRAEALAQVAAGLEADAAAVGEMAARGELPWVSMLGARISTISDAQMAAAILRRDAEIARDLAGTQLAPAPAPAAGGE